MPDDYDYNIIILLLYNNINIIRRSFRSDAGCRVESAIRPITLSRMGLSGKAVGIVTLDKSCAVDHVLRCVMVELTEPTWRCCSPTSLDERRVLELWALNMPHHDYYYLLLLLYYYYYYYYYYYLILLLILLLL